MTVGFTCGIAVTIFASQLKHLGGLKLPSFLASLAAWLFGLPGPLMPSISYAFLLEVLPAAPLHCSAASASPERSPVPPPIFVPEPTARSPAWDAGQAALDLMEIAAPLASFIPLSALAGVLMAVCWNMAAKEDVLHLLREWRGASVVLATFGSR